MVSNMAVFKDAKALFKNTARYLNDYIVHERANIYFENTVKVMRKEIKAHHDDAYEIEYENKAEGVATRRLTIVPKKGHESKALMYEYKDRKSVV